MTILRNVTGFSAASGVAQKGKGAAYSIGRLYWLKPIREWSNEFGQQVTTGFKADERDALDIDLNRPPLVAKLQSFKYPLDIRIEVEPHPDDPLRNVIVDAFELKPENKG